MVLWYLALSVKLQLSDRHQQTSNGTVTCSLSLLHMVHMVAGSTGLVTLTQVPQRGVTVTVMAHLFPFPLIHDTRQCFQTNQWHSLGNTDEDEGSFICEY